MDGFYKDSYIYVVTHMKSHKMKEIMSKAEIAVCKDLFSGQGLGENMGHSLLPKNKDVRKEVPEIFSKWYNLHVDENDSGTNLLKIKLTTAVAFSQDTKYSIDFVNKTAESIPFINTITI